MKIARLAVTLLFMGIVVVATPSNCPTTGPGTDLGTLNTDGGCIQIDALFSTFAVSSSGTLAAPGLPDIDLFGSGTSPLTADAIFNTPGVNTWSTPGDNTGGSLNTTLTFVATLQDGNEFNALGINSVGFTGNGLIDITETYCLGATTTVGCAAGNGGSISVVIFNGSILSDTSPATFAQISNIVAISEQIQLPNISGSPTSITSIDNQFEAPEPSTMLLMGTSGLVLGMLRRRARRS